MEMPMEQPGRYTRIAITFAREKRHSALTRAEHLFRPVGRRAKENAAGDGLENAIDRRRERLESSSAIDRSIA